MYSLHPYDIDYTPLINEYHTPIFFPKKHSVATTKMQKRAAKKRRNIVKRKSK